VLVSPRHQQGKLAVLLGGAFRASDVLGPFAEPHPKRAESEGAAQLRELGISASPLWAFYTVYFLRKLTQSITN